MVPGSKIFKPQSLLLSELNLILTDDWHDLVTGQRLSDVSSETLLGPYQVLWITNLPEAK